MRGFRFSKAQPGQGGFNFDRVAKRGMGDNADFFTFHQPKFEKTLQQARRSRHGIDSPLAAKRNLVQSRHQTTFAE